MSKYYNWKISWEDYNLLKNGLKKLEIRFGYPDVQKVEIGDIIIFNNSPNISFRVIRKAQYSSMKSLVISEKLYRCYPFTSPYKASTMWHSFYPEVADNLGIYVFEVRKQFMYLKFRTLSSLLESPILFSKYISKIYEVIKCLNNDYPNFENWFWNVQLPRICNGTGEILVCMQGSNIAGVTILKNCNGEKKICTFFVTEDYRNNLIAGRLFTLSFVLLETKKPLMSIPEYKVHFFNPFIDRYDWKLTQVKPQGYYNNNYREFVYNGTLND